MANKTIDRKKAVPARSQAAKVSPKGASGKATRPGGNNAGKPSDPKQEKASRAGAEVLEVEEVEPEALEADEEAEVDEEAVDEADEVDETDEADEADEEEFVEEEEEVVEEEPAKSRFAKSKNERDLVASPQDYSISRSTKSRLPTFPGSQFLYSSYRELRLVTWPSRRDTWNWSLVVVGVCVAVAIVLGAADLGLSRFVTWWLSLAH
ncbi:MAG TPA: preprotein translocase subunit SecE [Ktedonobacterales bacterium]|jgi:preprotein translocase SecE subunit